VCGGHVKQTREIKEGDRICQQYSDLRGLNSKFVFKAKKELQVHGMKKIRVKNKQTQNSQCVKGKQTGLCVYGRGIDIFFSSLSSKVIHTR